MAHRDLTRAFHGRRANLKQRKLRFQLRHLVGTAPYLPLFQSTNAFKVNGMDRALLQEPREFVGLETGEVPRPDWIRFADDANEAVRLLHVKVEYLQLVHTRRLMIRFDDAEDAHEREIDALTDEISTLFQSADQALKNIMRPFIGGHACASAADQLVRQSTQRAIAARLQEISLHFRQRQREYVHRLELQRFGANLFVETTASSSHTDDGTATKSFSALSSAVLQNAEMETRSITIESRDAEIQRIARSVASLAAIFQEVASMVIDQGTLVDRIDYNMEQVATRMRSGLKELRRADQYERYTRPERCIFLLVSLISLCFVLLVIKHS